MARTSPTNVGPAEKTRRQEKATNPEASVSQTLTHGYDSLIESNAKLVDASTAAFIEKIMNFKTFETAVLLQSEFSKSQFEGFLAQTDKIREIYRDIATEAFKPIVGKLVKQTDLSSGDDEPSSAQWLEIKQLAFEEAALGLKKPHEHLASIRAQLAALRDVE